MRTWTLTGVLLASVLLAWGVGPQAHAQDSESTVEVVSTEPATPATLRPGERLTVSIRYEAGATDEVRIWIGPYTEGKRTSGFKPHRSGSYAGGSGRIEDWITFAKPASVDEIRVKLRTKSGKLLAEVSHKTDATWTGKPAGPFKLKPAKPVRKEALSPGKPFPTIAFESVDGRRISTDKLKGNVLLIDFWATWCGPCRNELPNVLAAYKEHHDDGFEIIGISLDSNRKALSTFIEKNRMTWPQYFDGGGWNNKISTRFHVDGIPRTFLIDRRGVLRYDNLWGEQLKQGIATLCAEPRDKAPSEAAASR